MGPNKSTFSFVSSLVKNKKHSWSLSFNDKKVLRTTLFLDGDLLNEVSSKIGQELTKEESKKIHAYFDTIQKKIKSIDYIIHKITLSLISFLNVILILKNDFTFNWEKTCGLLVLNSLILIFRKKITHLILKCISKFI